MTVQEAITTLNVIKRQASFEDVGKAIGKGIEALEKQIPKKPTKIEPHGQYNIDIWVECLCGAMGCHDKSHGQSYCWKCGQLLSWEEGGTSD